jgi:beta-phosphoglucomutase-like phosphatase (HAD superfamily)
VSGLLIFDFGGVVADSEVLANRVLAEIVTDVGVPTTLEGSYRQYMGKRFAEVIAAVEAVVAQADAALCHRVLERCGQDTPIAPEPGATSAPARNYRRRASCRSRASGGRW